MCAMLAEQYNLLLCGENYCTDKFLGVATPENQPHMTYFKTHNNWQQFLNRTPETYAAWIEGNSRELADFEIAELIALSSAQRVIVDTNIPIDILKDIADYHQVAIMLSPQAISIDSFFDRQDPEKQFLLSQIQKADNPERTMENFKMCLARINSQEAYNNWANSGFFTVVRKDTITDTRKETMEKLAAHFGLVGSSA